MSIVLICKNNNNNKTNYMSNITFLVWLDFVLILPICICY